jgi:hypothetical protein
LDQYSIRLLLSLCKSKPNEGQPEEAEAVRAAMARYASTWFIDLSLGHTYALKQSSHGT